VLWVCALHCTAQAAATTTMMVAGVAVAADATTTATIQGHAAGAGGGRAGDVSVCMRVCMGRELQAAEPAPDTAAQRLPVVVACLSKWHCCSSDSCSTARRVVRSKPRCCCGVAAHVGGRSGPPPLQRRRDALPDDVVAVTELKKHTKV
jgi:hypothetical protein